MGEEARGTAPSRADGVARGLSEWLGGPVGRVAVVGSQGWARVASVLAAGGAVVLALGVVTKGHCVANGWVVPDQYWRMCYSDVPVVTVSAGLTEPGAAALFSGGAGLDQPPLAGAVLRVLGWVSPAGAGVLSQQVVFATWAVLAVLLLAGAVVAATWAQPGRPWQTAHLALSPVLVTAGLVSVDLLGIALTLWAVWAWRRQHPTAAGVLLGLALLTRSLPLVLLLAVVLVGLRRGQRPAVGRLLVAAGATLALLIGPFLLLQPALVTGWWETWRSAGPGYGSLQLLLTSTYDDDLGRLVLSVGVSTGVAVLGWLVGVALGAWLALGTGRRVDEITVAAVILLPVLLTAKAVPVQIALWMLPLLALSSVRWRDHLVWAGAEIVYFAAVWLHLGAGSDPDRGLPVLWFALATLLRWAGWTWLTVQLVRSRDDAPPASEPGFRRTASSRYAGSVPPTVLPVDDARRLSAARARVEPVVDARNPPVTEGP